MRTTVEIPDRLFRQAKLMTVEEKTTMRELVIRGLELVLRKSVEGERRLTGPPVQLSADSPLRTMSPEDFSSHDAEMEAAELDEVYRRR